jgi:SAM-dependent methyltransferase
VADFPIDLGSGLAERFAQAFDVEGKIPRTFETIASLAGSDVVLVDGGPAGVRARQLAELGARLSVVDSSAPSPLETIGDGAADAVVSCWSWFRERLPESLLSAERVLRVGGRLLVLHDYGRDDVSRLRSPDLPEYTTWSRRDGWFLRAGFKVRVIHCWWTFESVDDAAGFLDEAFGEVGRTVGSGLKRPRLSYNVAIYHWTKAVLQADR